MEGKREVSAESSQRKFRKEIDLVLSQWDVFKFFRKYRKGLHVRKIKKRLTADIFSWFTQPSDEPLVDLICLLGSAMRSQHLEVCDGSLEEVAEKLMKLHKVCFDANFRETYMGPNAELKLALELFWDGKSSAVDLQQVAAGLRASIWKQMDDAGMKYIPSNTFSYFDQVLDTTAMVGAVPARYGWKGGEIGFDVYFSMARGNASVPGMEMTRWSYTNFHFIVPELGPDVKFSYASHKAVQEFKEAKALGFHTVPVLVGPVSYLLMSKPAEGVDKSFSSLSLIDNILPVYIEVVTELKAAGATWIQFDEFVLGKDSDSPLLPAFTHAYSELESSITGLNVLIAKYFVDMTPEAYISLASLRGISRPGLDLDRLTKTLDFIEGGFPYGKYLFSGVVDGHNILGKDRLLVCASCSLLETAVDLTNETMLDKEIKSWISLSPQKVVEVNAMAKALSTSRDEAFFPAPRRSLARKSNEAVHNSAAALKGCNLR